MHGRPTLMLGLVDVMLCCCLGFGTLNIHCLYSLVFRESSLMFTHTSRKGNLPSCSGSVVNLMLESRLFRWVVNSSTW